MEMEKRAKGMAHAITTLGTYLAGKVRRLRDVQADCRPSVPSEESRRRDAQLQIDALKDVQTRLVGVLTAYHLDDLAIL